MREQLIQYVELLFAGAGDCEDIKQEILQNTLDRYDDLVDSGKVPEAAYRLAIAGIGDVNEIMGTQAPHPAVSRPAVEEDDGDTPKKKLLRAIAVGLYIISMLPLIVLGDLGMGNLGLCGTLSIVAVATVMILLAGKKERPEKDDKESDDNESELNKSISAVLWAVGLGVYFLLSFTTRAWHITWVIFPVLVALDSLVSAIIRIQEARHSTGIVPCDPKVRNAVKSLIWAVGLAIYFIFSFATNAWYITWLLFPIIGAVQGLTMAVMDLKEAMKHET